MRQVRLRHQTKWWDATANATEYTVRYGANGSKGQVKVKAAVDCKAGSPYRELEFKLKGQLADGYQLLEDTNTPDVTTSPAPTNSGWFCEFSQDFGAVCTVAAQVAVAMGLNPSITTDTWSVEDQGQRLVLRRSFPLSFEIPAPGTRATLVGLALAVKGEAEVYNASGSIDAYDTLEALFVAEKVSDDARSVLHEMGLMSAPTQVGPKISQSHGIPMY